MIQPTKKRYSSRCPHRTVAGLRPSNQKDTSVGSDSINGGWIIVVDDVGERVGSGKRIYERCIRAGQNPARSGPCVHDSCCGAEIHVVNRTTQNGTSSPPRRSDFRSNPHCLYSHLTPKAQRRARPPSRNLLDRFRSSSSSPPRWFACSSSYGDGLIRSEPSSRISPYSFLP